MNTQREKQKGQAEPVIYFLLFFFILEKIYEKEKEERSLNHTKRLTQILCVCQARSVKLLSRCVCQVPPGLSKR